MKRTLPPKAEIKPDIDAVSKQMEDLMKQHNITAYVFAIWKPKEDNPSKGSWRTRWNGNNELLFALVLAIKRGIEENFGFKASQ